MVEVVDVGSTVVEVDSVVLDSVVLDSVVLDSVVLDSVVLDSVVLDSVTDEEDEELESMASTSPAVRAGPALPVEAAQAAAPPDKTTAMTPAANFATRCRPSMNQPPV